MDRSRINQQAMADLAYIQSRWRNFEIIEAELQEPTRRPGVGRSSTPSSPVEVTMLARAVHVELWDSVLRDIDRAASALAQARKVIKSVTESEIGKEITQSAQNQMCDGRGLPGFNEWGERDGCSNHAEHRATGLCARCQKRLQRWQERNRGGIVTR